MKNAIKVSVILLMISSNVFGQKYITKNGNISFFSDASAEKIEAVNKQVYAAFDVSTGDLVFKVLMKSFEFEKALMQEHFNENYVESDKYPNATFKGKITNLDEVNFAKNGNYKVMTEGELMIHGVTNKIKCQGMVDIKDGKIFANAKFTIALKDYNIKIPSVVVKNIAENIDITVNIALDKIK
jgi:polyisoprenoid-binding protein YceI